MRLSGTDHDRPTAARFDLFSHPYRCVGVQVCRYDGGFLFGQALLLGAQAENGGWGDPEIDGILGRYQRPFGLGAA